MRKLTKRRTSNQSLNIALAISYQHAESAARTADEDQLQQRLDGIAMRAAAIKTASDPEPSILRVPARTRIRACLARHARAILAVTAALFTSSLSVTASMVVRVPTERGTLWLVWAVIAVLLPLAVGLTLWVLFAWGLRCGMERRSELIRSMRNRRHDRTPVS